jgi:TetR/AcrR family transcriptional repressor of lmrAB and yxaGH operons
MPAALTAKERAEIVDRLFMVFRDRGYEGASLADLSRATGLGKSSLYHHFPNGKEQMAEAVLEKGKAFIQSAVVDVATSSSPLRARIRKVIGLLTNFMRVVITPVFWADLLLPRSDPAVVS